ncbi:unnamed protein product [Urochloa humidicola]
MLVKSYKNENTLSGGTACKWYINEEIPEIEAYFDRVYMINMKKLSGFPLLISNLSHMSSIRILKKKLLCSFAISIPGSLRNMVIVAPSEFLGSTKVIPGGSHRAPNVTDLLRHKETNIVALEAVLAQLLSQSTIFP